MNTNQWISDIFAHLTGIHKFEEDIDNRPTFGNKIRNFKDFPEMEKFRRVRIFT